MRNDIKAQGSSIISGVLIAYAITCIVFIGYAILLTYTDMGEEGISLVVTITSIISAMVAGFDAAKGANSKGWMWGMIAGLIYALILVAIMTWVQKGFTMNSRLMTLIILSIASGGLGGVIGINMKK
ncbi:TIGR04086 family membrane protein [Anaeropeptidivorans aminofermentans]|uniref:TIGR04086 family membrane protein n=1 Tax=Anaeropeptidivorans aminofermentans TaxID=2934315 RepID=UPI002025A49F|nr:TIGR04086 family membrane protein [Anaeropeptidivorans aminofermentans]